MNCLNLLLARLKDSPTRQWHRYQQTSISINRFQYFNLAAPVVSIQFSQCIVQSVLYSRTFVFQSEPLVTRQYWISLNSFRMMNLNRFESQREREKTYNQIVLHTFTYILHNIVMVAVQYFMKKNKNAHSVNQAHLMRCLLTKQKTVV